ncbi:MAG: sortase [Oscillospiraceae bacterium]|nr:sortase [Oscillospiraceae bacterium]
MKRKFGILFIIIGILLILAALLLIGYNRYESQSASKASQSVLAVMQNTVEETTVSSAVEDVYVDHIDPYDQDAAEIAAEMTEKEIDGQYYIGYLSIPILELELPVISEWSYPRLRIAPCRHFGSTKTDDLVIAAHNYESHFGKLKQLKTGDLLTFTDMDGEKILYEVQVIDVLQPTAVDAVKNSDFDLVLYTCTYGGESRVVVFCNRVKL